MDEKTMKQLREALEYKPKTPEEKANWDAILRKMEESGMTELMDYEPEA